MSCLIKKRYFHFLHNFQAFMTQIIYCIIHRCLFFLFSYLCCSLIPVSKTQSIERMLTLLYQCKWQNVDKMNEKRSLGYQGVSTEYVTGQINSAASFETILPFDFSTILKILIGCSLIKHFPNDHKRYCSYIYKYRNSINREL